MFSILQCERIKRNILAAEQSFKEEIKYVIIDVGAKNWFFVSEVIETERRLGIAGTSSFDDIGSIVSKLSLDEIIDMTERTIGRESESCQSLSLVYRRWGWFKNLIVYSNGGMLPIEVCNLS